MAGNTLACVGTTKRPVLTDMSRAEGVATVMQLYQFLIQKAMSTFLCASRLRLIRAMTVQFAPELYQRLDRHARR